MGTEIANFSEYSTHSTPLTARPAWRCLVCGWRSQVGLLPTGTRMCGGRPAMGERGAIPPKTEKEATMTRPMTWAMLILVGVGLWPAQVTLAQEPQLGEAD